MRMATAASVVLLLALTGCGSGDRAGPAALPRTPSVATTTAADPIGPPPEIPWWRRGVLHVEGRTIRTPLSRIVTGGGTTLVGATGDRGSTWRRVVGGRLLPFLSTPHATEPRVSANGAHIAWVTTRVLHRFNRYTTRTAFTVTAYDVQRGRQVGSATLTSRATCCDAGGVVDVLGVNDDGAVVIYRMGGPSWMWWPGRAPVQIRLPLDRWLDASDQWPHGITYAIHQDGWLPAAYARVDHRGRVHRLGTVPVASTGKWSPDGTAYAFSPASKTRDYRARVWAAGSVTRFDAPRAAQVFLWESAQTVLLEGVGDADVDPIRLFRCDTSSGACERAGRPLRHVQLPDTLPF
jgi:hypothetical protein